MPALIDNYSTTPEVETLMTTKDVDNEYSLTEYNVFYVSCVSSIVLNNKKSYNINKRIEILLKEYSTLTRNWDNDDALPPFPDVINDARYLTALLGKHGQQIFHAAPGPNERLCWI
jgi:hypothetical protein